MFSNEGIKHLVLMDRVSLTSIVSSINKCDFLRKKAMRRFGRLGRRSGVRKVYW